MRRIGFAARPLRAALIAPMLAAVVAAGVASPAAACIGQYLSGDPHLDENADVIFTGTAVRENDPIADGSIFEWVFVVDGIEKGSVAQRTTVRTPEQDSMCGFRFELGTRYRVLATANSFPPQLDVSSVGGTMPIESLPNPPPVEDLFEQSDWLLPVALVTLAGFIGLVLWISSSRRRRAAHP